MTETTSETVVAQAEAWQQFYQSWLALMGADAIIDAIYQCNKEALETLRSQVDPSWQIPLRWLEEMTNIIEKADAPEPIRTVSLNMAESGKICVEAARECSEQWYQVPQAMNHDAWMEPVSKAMDSWQTVSGEIFALNLKLVKLLGNGHADTAADTPEADAPATKAEASGGNTGLGQTREKAQQAESVEVQRSVAM